MVFYYTECYEETELGRDDGQQVVENEVRATHLLGRFLVLYLKKSVLHIFRR